MAHQSKVMHFTLSVHTRLGDVGKWAVSGFSTERKKRKGNRLIAETAEQEENAFSGKK